MWMITYSDTVILLQLFKSSQRKIEIRYTKESERIFRVRLEVLELNVDSQVLGSEWGFSVAVEGSRADKGFWECERGFSGGNDSPREGSRDRVQVLRCEWWFSGTNDGSREQTRFFGNKPTFPRKNKVFQAQIKVLEQSPIDHTDALTLLNP